MVNQGTSQFTMTMWQHTITARIFATYKHGCHLSPALLTQFCYLSFVSQNKTTARQALFPWCPWNSGTITNSPKLYSKESVSAVVETLDPLHKLGSVTMTNNKVKQPLHYPFSPGTSAYSLVHPQTAAQVKCRSWSEQTNTSWSAEPSSSQH